MEFAFREQREDGSFLADHAAHQGVHADEQRELGEVLAQPEAQPEDGVRVGGGHPR